MASRYFSILLPVHNAAPYLETALASLLYQDHPHFEIIAIDDGSTDGSLGILEAHAERDRRVRLVSREHRGVVVTRNEGLRLASADLVALMDADDISYRGRLSTQAAAFDADPGLGLCGSDYDEIIGGRLIRSRSGAGPERHDARILSLFFSPFTHSTVVFNRKLIDAADLVYDPAYPCAEDFELLRRLAAKYRTRRIETSLVAYRIHAASISSLERRRQQGLHLRIVAENLGRAGLVDPAALAELGSAAETGALTDNLAMRAADCLGAIETAIERGGSGDRPSYRVGVRNLFHDVYQVLLDQDPMLLRRFLDRTGKWGWARPSDRLWLAAYGRSRRAGAAARAATELAEAGWRRLRSLPLSTVMPHPPGDAGG